MIYRAGEETFPNVHRARHTFVIFTARRDAAEVLKTSRSLIFLRLSRRTASVVGRVRVAADDAKCNKIVNPIGA